MSLISGVIYFDGKLQDDETIQRMMDAGKESCPDGAGRWRDTGIALGFSLLQTLPAHRCVTAPFRDAGSGMVIVADARIDNRPELVQQLGLDGGKQRSDAEFILLAFQQWGEACVDHLIGDFAFAIWEAKARKLFCARDSFGIKPFYYFHSPQAFIFSSTVLSLLQAGEVSRELNDEFIADSLAGLTQDGQATVYQDIAALAAAHCLSISAGKISLRRYWEPGSANESVHFARDEDYVERFRELFTESVRCRAETEGDAASLLSGGLDSSSIAAVAGQLLAERNQRLTTYSFVLADHERQFTRDEKDLIALLHDLPGLDGHYISSENFVTTPPDMRYETSHHLPVGYSPYLATLFSRMREKKIRVLFDGFGGDLCVTCESPPPLRELVGGFQFPRLFNYVRAASGFNGSTAPGVIKQLLVKHFRGNGNADMNELVLSRSVLSPDLRERTQILARARNNPSSESVSKQSLREIMRQRLRQAEKAFRMSELFSLSQVEMRYPMLDRRLVEFCLVVPSEQHNFDMNRRLIRKAMAGRLPDEVRLRHNKFISNAPGALDFVFKHRAFYLAAIEAAGKNGAAAEYIDLVKLEQRFSEALPKAVNSADKKDFMPGPTLRGFDMLQFLVSR